MSLSISQARGIAAQAWCDPKNEKKTIDQELCDSFADRLVTTVKAEIIMDRFHAARQMMIRCFQADHALAQIYANSIERELDKQHVVVAGGVDGRRQLASDILALIFSKRATSKEEDPAKRVAYADIGSMAIEEAVATVREWEEALKAER